VECTGNLFEGPSPKNYIIRWSVHVSLTGHNYEQFRWYGMNKGKVFMSCVLYTNGYVNVNEWMNALSILTVVIK
jgi:hypothetical protein